MPSLHHQIPASEADVVKFQRRKYFVRDKNVFLEDLDPKLLSTGTLAYKEKAIQKVKSEPRRRRRKQVPRVNRVLHDVSSCFLPASSSHHYHQHLCKEAEDNPAACLSTASLRPQTVPGFMNMSRSATPSEEIRSLFGCRSQGRLSGGAVMSTSHSYPSLKYTQSSNPDFEIALDEAYQQCQPYAGNIAEADAGRTRACIDALEMYGDYMFGDEKSTLGQHYQAVLDEIKGAIYSKIPVRNDNSHVYKDAPFVPYHELAVILRNEKFAFETEIKRLSDVIRKKRISIKALQADLVLQEKSSAMCEEGMGRSKIQKRHAKRKIEMHEKEEITMVKEHDKLMYQLADTLKVNKEQKAKLETLKKKCEEHKMNIKEYELKIKEREAL